MRVVLFYANGMFSAIISSLRLGDKSIFSSISNGIINLGIVMLIVEEVGISHEPDCS